MVRKLYTYIARTRMLESSRYFGVNINPLQTNRGFASEYKGNIIGISHIEFLKKLQKCLPVSLSRNTGSIHNVDFTVQPLPKGLR